ncbi:hypothetical protein SOVF_139810 [Spinacia oleracea]|nr:hypothetical protein SOVF_139810 [Spinacia oleracea]
MPQVLLAKHVGKAIDQLLLLLQLLLLKDEAESCTTARTAT